MRERVLGETSGHGTTGVAIVLGRGMRLWDDLRELERDYSVTSEVAESGVIHFAFAR
ncbi:hypothetical protein [Salinibacterium sp.]|uniref:hypothetical protein n=1 Tax=Salinibacterium sp. TaxID=1915057 RepID=UPI00286A374F|nr:hypothetical protein [Salinibacterium sp.]